MPVSELLAARLILGTIFLVSSFGKLSSSTLLAEEIMDYQLLSRSQARIVAAILPFVELVLGAFYILSIVLPIISSLTILLLMIFTSAIVINLIRGKRFSCHCFGSSSTMIGPMTVLRNILLITLATFVTLKSLSLLSMSSTIRQWQLDIQLLTHLDAFVPIVGAALLSLGILYLLGEVDSIRFADIGVRHRGKNNPR